MSSADEEMMEYGSENKTGVPEDKSGYSGKGTKAV